MRIDEEHKIFALWLTAGENQDPGLRESLKPLYQQYHDRKYLVAVFLSGGSGLYEGTRDLLLYNRRRTAEKAVRAARESLQSQSGD